MLSQFNYRFMFFSEPVVSRETHERFHPKLGIRGGEGSVSSVMKEFFNSWPGIILAVGGSALIGHYLGFLVWLLCFVIFVLLMAFQHSKNPR